jgi:hypothetical protein
MIKNARTVTMAGSGHHLASQNQDILARELLPFLEDPLKDSGSEIQDSRIIPS